MSEKNPEAPTCSYHGCSDACEFRKFHRGGRYVRFCPTHRALSNNYTRKYRKENRHNTSAVAYLLKQVKREAETLRGIGEYDTPASCADQRQRLEAAATLCQMTNLVEPRDDDTRQETRLADRILNQYRRREGFEIRGKETERPEFTFGNSPLRLQEYREMDTTSKAKLHAAQRRMIKYMASLLPRAKIDILSKNGLAELTAHEKRSKENQLNAQY